MNLKITKQDIFVIILLAILFGGTTLTGLGSADSPVNPAILKLRHVMVFASLMLLILIKLFSQRNERKWYFNNQTIPLVWSWILFCFSIIMSGFINTDIFYTKSGYWLMLGVPLIFFVTLPKLMQESANIIVAMSLIIGHLPYLFSSIWLYPPYTYELNFYRGIFSNSNQMGYVSVATASGLFILLIGALLTKKSNYYIFLLISLLIGTFILIYYAFARTSMITFFAMLLVCCLIVFSKNRQAFAKIAFVAAFAFSLILYELDKFSQFISYDLGINVLDIIQRKDYSMRGRETIWIKTIDEASFWGHGEGYHINLFNIGAHNTIIKFLGDCGLISACLLVVFAIISFRYAYSYFKTNFQNDPYAIAPLIITLCFWTLSMGEDMFGALGKGITLAYFVSIGIVMNKSIHHRKDILKGNDNVLYKQ